MKIKFVIIFLLLLQFPLLCQYNGNDFSIGIYGVYTKSASIFLNPNASDIVLRNRSFVIEDILNPGADIRIRVSEPLIIGLSVEYIEITESAPNLTVFDSVSVVTLLVEDGFKLIPVELTAYYQLPFSTERWKFLMGGGLAYYNGEFIRKVGDTAVSNVKKGTDFGIQVSVSMDYVPINQVVLRFQMKFRDPQFTVTSQNDQGEPFDTKINMDGITFMLGAAIQF